jgi:hypothetical protein
MGINLNFKLQFVLHGKPWSSTMAKPSTTFLFLFFSPFPMCLIVDPLGWFDKGPNVFDKSCVNK